ncbi:hypothetical protein [Virgisporangium aurantiacum]|uniref:Uncharacterized protein n=1 Tax=Virgisporangium aurantiacum TaxID=175570 RepID=A0A8J3Z8M2_9ACTN|nr:hypothetical protein [Virgisporangium aurantiacum]GIJ56945.1 hypothetical protein Vau01_044610 [Virgisporangium aurantiacum]
MATVTTTSHRPSTAPPTVGAATVGGPVTRGWREATLTRAMELRALCAWALPSAPTAEQQAMADAIWAHVDAARDAATAASPEPRRRLHFFRHGPLHERAMSNLDAAESLLINIAKPEYVLGQVPCVLRSVRCHLVATDPRRLEMERIARRLGIRDVDGQEFGTDLDLAARKKIIEDERGRIATAARGASSAALREQRRIRSFGAVLVVSIVVMFALAIALAILGFWRPTTIPMCFAPQERGTAIVVCPTAQSAPFPVTTEEGSQEDIDDQIRRTANRHDLLVVELVGLTAAAIAAAAAIGKIRGSSERNLVPVALAVFKLPTGAVTAFLGLLLMRGQFVPGLTALDTSAQIVAWAIIFGYAQQAFTRLVDRQAHVVLDTVRGADTKKPQPQP